MTKIFRTLAHSSEGIYKERGSKFIAYAFPVNTEQEIKRSLDEVRTVHAKARHVCYGWILGPDGDRYSASDAGEPPNSAGAPILGQIRSHQLTNILIVVVRYFGGSKLGIPGLINAYKQAAADAIGNSKIIAVIERESIGILTSYTSIDQVLNFINKKNVVILDKSFTDKCELKLGVPKDEKGMIIEALKQFKDTYICD